ncbi:hypothetical protein BS50DRAFT_673814 [Corynespora cassiicola Philippines]|uniref:DUF6594 domain-containing protein n=1 Tax=Corynespora cassiicola Philippines TaxID=1448308 RepID=A0A2T2P0J1_CORCC|nr:hypothetical protein BS50DRAFT_673814 [Corynespora cassiicola Philippines]
MEGHAKDQFSEVSFKPWKTIGYRGFSAFLASDDDFLVFRQFGTLNARILLLLQDEIAELEKELEDVEECHSGPGSQDVHNGSFRQDPVLERKRLLNKIRIKVREYNELLIQHSTLRSRPRASNRQIRSISNWLWNASNAISDVEAGYIDKRYDLIPLVPRHTTPLRALLERSSRFRLARLWSNPPPKASLEIADFPCPETMHYSSETRIETTIGITITVLGMCMLIAPLWILASTEGTMKRLAVITGFIVLFLGLVAFTTVARPFESLAATAAYSAVLVVFLQFSV